MLSAIIVFAAGFIFGYWFATGTAPDIFPEGLPGSEMIEGMVGRLLPDR